MHVLPKFCHMTSKRSVWCLRNRWRKSKIFGPTRCFTVIECFKELHRARKAVFKTDTKALIAGRDKINEEFRKNKSVTDEEEISELLKTGNDAARYLRSVVVQAEWEDDRYYLKFTKDTFFGDNAKLKEKKGEKD